MKRDSGRSDPHASTSATSRDVGRRSLIRLVAAGGLGLAATTALPRRWTKPVVESVVLPVHAQGSPLVLPGLYGGSGGTGVTGELFRINTSTGAGTLVGALPYGVTEIEYDPSTRRAWAQSEDGSFTIQQFDMATGAGIGSPIGAAAAFNGLEYIGATLYGTAITGSGGPSDLRTLNPETGASVTIGATGFGPISGLAYRGGVLYGVTGGSNPASLVTINVTTGVATVIGALGIQAGGLQFGPDGRLYAGGNRQNGGNLYVVNTATGSATLIGPTGFLSVHGLTLV